MRGCWWVEFRAEISTGVCCGQSEVWCAIRLRDGWPEKMWFRRVARRSLDKFQGLRRREFLEEGMLGSGWISGCLGGNVGCFRRGKEGRSCRRFG